jgi:hypothetical protein
MRKCTYITLAALLVCGASLAGQLSTTWTLRNVVDPPDLRDGLNADAQAADARLDSLETSYTASVVSNENGTLVMSNGTFNGAMEVAGPVTLTTDLTVANGGTGASTLTDGGVLLGSGTGAITAIAVGTNGQVPVGATGADPAFKTLTGDISAITSEGAVTFSGMTTNITVFDGSATNMLYYTNGLLRAVSNGI